MSPVEREILKLAFELYDQALARGEHFTVAELAERLTEELRSRYEEERSVIADLIATTATSAMKSVDAERTKPDPQATLFDDLDRAIPVDEGQRISRRRMGSRDWSAHLAHIASNVARVNASSAKENARFAALSPYLAAGMDTEAAIAAWVADHPEETLP